MDTEADRVAQFLGTLEIKDAKKTEYWFFFDESIIDGFQILAILLDSKLSIEERTYSIFGGGC